MLTPLIIPSPYYAPFYLVAKNTSFSNVDAKKNTKNIMDWTLSKYVLQLVKIRPTLLSKRERKYNYFG